MTYFPGVTSPLFPTGTIFSAYKSTTETRDNTASLTNDGYLFLNNIPSGYYRLTMVLYGKYFTDAGIQLILTGTNFAANGFLTDRSIWDETGADSDAPSDVRSHMTYSILDGYTSILIVDEDLISPSDLIQFRIGMTNGDIVHFTSTGSLALQWAQTLATPSRSTEIQSNSVLSLSFVHS